MMTNGYIISVIWHFGYDYVSLSYAYEFCFMLTNPYVMLLWRYDSYDI